MTDSERQVLAAMLTSTAAIDDASEILTGHDFAIPRHELIFDAILSQQSSGQPVDQVAIGNVLADDLERAGGRSYLAELVGELITATNVGWHAQEVLTASIRREIRGVGHNLQAIAESDRDPMEAVNEARSRIDAIAERDDAGDDNFTAVFAAIESLDRPLGIKTPWLPLSNAISGWAPGMLYVCGARPGVGKTVAGIGALLDMARRGQKALMISLEMPKNDLYLRMLSAVGNVSGEDILHRNISERDHARLRDAAHQIAGLNLTVDDRSKLSLAQIRAKIRSTQRKHHVGLVIIDYIGLVKPPPEAPRNDRRVQVDYIAQGLKNLARDLQVPILALAQLNREIEGRAVKRPTMADLRESGGIEAAADYIILMHRDIYETPETLQIELPKNRTGPQTTFSLTFEGLYSRITEPQWSSGRDAS